MEQKDYAEVRARLHAITPVLIDQTVELFKSDALLQARYGKNLREVAQQGVVSLRDVLLGALQFDHPRILAGELRWLERLLEARQIDIQTMRTNLALFRATLFKELSPEHSRPVLALFDQATEQFKQTEAAQR